GFSYPSYVPPGNRDGLAWLLRLRTAGLKVVYFGGNHDCWYGDYLRRAFDVAFFADAAELRLGGIRCYAAHGDGMATNEERGYLLLKRLLRSPFSIALYRLIPPAWGTALALWCSRQSRHHGREFDPPDAEPLWRVAQQR
ncbi:MAG TPA: hypothetical protein PKM88_12505, partial [bacterium]|nr:hypothetical protein [bacterium]